jgi:hypothetical protein
VQATHTFSVPLHRLRHAMAIVVWLADPAGTPVTARPTAGSTARPGSAQKVLAGDRDAVRRKHPGRNGATPILWFVLLFARSSATLCQM